VPLLDFIHYERMNQPKVIIKPFKIFLKNFCLLIGYMIQCRNELMKIRNILTSQQNQAKDYLRDDQEIKAS